MIDEQPKVIYIRAGTGGPGKDELQGLLGRIVRESAASSSQYFVLQLAPTQEVLNNPQSWKTLKQITLKQGMALVVSGGTGEVREMATAAGFPLVGTADPKDSTSGNIDRLRNRVLGYVLPEELGGLNLEQLAADYAHHEPDNSLRTIGSFIEFVKQRYGK